MRPRSSSVLARSALFMVFASGLLGTAAAVARGPMGLGPNGYGGLLVAVGAGAVLGTAVLRGSATRRGSGLVVLIATLAYAGAMAVVGVHPSPGVVVAALVLGGPPAGSPSSPRSTRPPSCCSHLGPGPALAYFQLVFMGGQALGAVMWGAVADILGLTAAFLLPAAGLVFAALRGTAPGAAAVRARRPAQRTPVATAAALDWDPDAGPVLVTVEWRVREPRAGLPGRDARPRPCPAPHRRLPGGSVFQDAEDPELFLETFTVSTWLEHLRQHVERGTVADAALEERARAYLTGTGAQSSGTSSGPTRCLQRGHTRAGRRPERASRAGSDGRTGCGGPAVRPVGRCALLGLRCRRALVQGLSTPGWARFQYVGRPKASAGLPILDGGPSFGRRTG